MEEMRTYLQVLLDHADKCKSAGCRDCQTLNLVCLQLRKLIFYDPVTRGWRS